MKVWPTFIIDADVSFRSALVRSLETSIYYVVFAQPDPENLLWVSHGERILVLIGMAGPRADVFATTANLRNRFPSARIVVMTSALERGECKSSIDAGANGFIPKSIGPDQISNVLDCIMLGENLYFFEEQRSQAVSPARAEALPALSDRQLQILTRLTYGESNKLIARACQISEQTVKAHVKAILQKIHVRNRTEAAIWAVDRLPTLRGAHPARQPKAGRPDDVVELDPRRDAYRRFIAWNSVISGDTGRSDR
jgi:two-component system nitrate/nitrite response regulator NarL